MKELVLRGVDVFRINAAHGKIPDFEQTLETIRRVRESTGFPVAVLLDLSGPKIRLGQLAQDPLDVEPGQELTMVRGEVATKPGQLCSTYGRLIDEVKPNDRLCWPMGRFRCK